MLAQVGELGVMTCKIRIFFNCLAALVLTFGAVIAAIHVDVGSASGVMRNALPKADLSVVAYLHDLLRIAISGAAAALLMLVLVPRKALLYATCSALAGCLLLRPWETLATGSLYQISLVFFWVAMVPSLYWVMVRALGTHGKSPKSGADAALESLSLHVAGATVRHKSPFSDLKVIENPEPLTIEFTQKYVDPFYLSLRDSDEFKEKYVAIKDSVDSELVSKLLGDFNWRSRVVGAYFAALGGMDEFEQNIGNLLLRSDVCYAGQIYCLALASFSSPEAIDYLSRYLEYYLDQQDLWFDQDSAMAALAFMGANRGEDLVGPHMAAWETFVSDKPNLKLASSIEDFFRQMQVLDEFKREVSS